MGYEFDKFCSKAANAVGKAMDAAKTVVTAGGYNALQESYDRYQMQMELHRSSVHAFHSADRRFKEALESLGAESNECNKLLGAAKSFVERLSCGEMTSDTAGLPGFRCPDMHEVQRTMNEFSAAVTAGQGSAISMAASAGAWMMVAHFGTASTGTAIASLSGAAAHSAILAWFGGGSLAAGGGGMALGGLTIGVVAAVPLIAFSAFKSYKEASRIDVEREKVKEATAHNHDGAAKLQQLEAWAHDLRRELEHLRAGFVDEFQAYRRAALALAEDMAEKANRFASRIRMDGNAMGASA